MYISSHTKKLPPSPKNVQYSYIPTDPYVQCSCIYIIPYAKKEPTITKICSISIYLSIYISNVLANYWNFSQAEMFSVFPILPLLGHPVPVNTLQY